MLQRKFHVGRRRCGVPRRRPRLHREVPLEPPRREPARDLRRDRAVGHRRGHPHLSRQLPVAVLHGARRVPRCFRSPPNKVRMVAHPHGGSFGGKGGTRGTDITALLSRKSGGRPVKWIEDRMEYLIGGAGQAWDRHYEASLAVDARRQGRRACASSSSTTSARRPRASARSAPAKPLAVVHRLLRDPRRASTT